VRILAVADVHGVLEVYDWLRAEASSADLAILAGDLLAGDVPSEQQKLADQIVLRLRKWNVPIFYIMGNDDNVSLGYNDDKITPIHGRRVDLGDFNFVGYQFTPPFVGETFVKDEEAIEEDLRLLEPLVDGRSVFVTHAPAFGHLDVCFSGSVGSPSIAQFLSQRPFLAHIHGHIHEEFGRDANHFNVASAGICRAMKIEIPSLDHHVITRESNW
jgi:Icc-related predicted phosphoesterase